MVRLEMTDEQWAALAPLFPAPKGRGRPPMDTRETVEGIAWRFRTGAPWRDIPERFGNWNSIYQRFSDWSADGTWARLLATVQGAAAANDEVEWTVSVDSTVTRVHQHGATLGRTQGAGSSYTNPCHRPGGLEPPDHAIGRSRGGVTCKIHLATDGKGRPLGLVLTGGNAADTSFFTTVLDTISVRDGRPGRPRTRPDRVLADKAYTAAANRRYLSDRGIKITIPEGADQKAGRARRGPAGGRPRSFDAEAYKGRNVVERCFNKLKQWRGIATRFDKTARSYLAGLTLAAALIWTR